MSPINLHCQTPLKKVDVLSQYLPGRDVYLKMESSQVTGSFKMRGIGCRARKAVENGCTHLLSCSGGNAGLATAEAARLLSVPCTAVVPQTTTQRMISRIQEKGATVICHGDNFNTAQRKAFELVNEIEGSVYVSPYDHPDIWEGCTTVVRELSSEMPERPAVIVASVGGGGLLTGILDGLKEVGWQDVPVLAMETYGAHCFNLSMKASQIVAMEKITSIATSLGARTVTEGLMERVPHFKVISEVVEDKAAVQSCLKFAELENVVVEPACGATLAALYSGILSRLDSEHRLPPGPAVLIVCGGTGVTLDQLQTWATQLQ
ncbi:L-serine dehydratase/L-threonine deaminase-like [Schistocerca cancellata]|uniref:L-serine dehydratase/L-threonine deaminase-like n=1 Tax=Schistocerca cancellata TaxID=274614 RepID=UPI002119A853|nr:L-serine dehydratase/L-threonine deaminase-like [Schistocerca cancellata]XP_049785215.1 L-serine dehydratase/L-threonine deaminase-like [Schistocerca cancellata]